jgi:hypothetical protein
LPGIAVVPVQSPHVGFLAVRSNRLVRVKVQHTYRKAKSCALYTLPRAESSGPECTARINAGKTEEAKKIKADMELFENEHLPGRKHVAAGVIWIGSQYEGNGAIQFLFRVMELHGSRFKARMERNFSVGGHPMFNVDCRLDGILIEVTRKSSVQGGMALAKCNGILLGQTLLLQLTTLQETTVRRKQRVITSNTSFAVLRMQKK